MALEILSMRRTTLVTLVAVLLVVSGCGGSKPSNNTVLVPTAPPAQTAVIRASTPSRAGITTPEPPSNAVTGVVDQLRLKITELPRDFGYGQFAAYQSNEAAVAGFDDPVGVLDRMNKTGRLGGYVQQLTTPDGPTAAYTIEVWKDAAGAKAYFDQFPRPDKSLSYKVITLPQPLGDQSFAYQYDAGSKTGYSIAWRRGRFILGAGDSFASGKESLDRIMQIVNLLDQKAQSLPQ